jgi:predicted alpha/beta hydrolase
MATQVARVRRLIRAWDPQHRRCRFVARDPKITPAPQMKAALPHPIVAVRAKHSIWANKG